MANPLEFIQEVRQEGAKVTWPTRKEVMITTAMVIVMVVLVALFFLVVDFILGLAASELLGRKAR
ncbi:MAG: preprotein translocase subunit SecE [Hyphomicrobiaceae bacterium]|nr:MAG: preprotein translocase subunit SecE [Hyphomicrobiaceae bacterium]